MKVGSSVLPVLLSPFVAISAALAVTVVVLVAAGVDPRVPLTSMIIGGFQPRTILKASPLILTGLGLAFSFKCGLVNLGAEGQIYIGALAATWMGLYLGNLPPEVLIPAILVCSFLAGGVWAAIPGFLKAKRDTSEVIVTFMMNFIAIFFVTFLLIGPMKGSVALLAQTDYISESARLPLIPGTEISSGIVLGFVASVLTYIIIWRTTLGFQIRAVGTRKAVAEYAGMNATRSVIIAMTMSGGLAGLAGMGEVIGLQYRLMGDISPGYGYYAIAVALIGKNNPVGIIIAAFLLGALLVGADSMRRVLGIRIGVVYLFEGLIIFFTLVAELLLRRMSR